MNDQVVICPLYTTELHLRIMRDGAIKTFTDNCSECGRKCILAESSKELVESNSARMLCDNCGEKFMNSDTPRVLGVTPRQLNEFEQILLSKQRGNN